MEIRKWQRDEGIEDRKERIWKKGKDRHDDSGEDGEEGEKGKERGKVMRSKERRGEGTQNRSLDSLCPRRQGWQEWKSRKKKKRKEDSSVGEQSLNFNIKGGFGGFPCCSPLTSNPEHFQHGYRTFSKIFHGQLFFFKMADACLNHYRPQQISEENRNPPQQ